MHHPLTQAIECGNVKKFSSTLDGMADVFKDNPSNSALNDGFIDVCIVSPVVSRHTRRRCYYFMSLLAYAAIQSQKTMVDILIARNASKLSLFGPISSTLYVA